MKQLSCTHIYHGILLCFEKAKPHLLPKIWVEQETTTFTDKQKYKRYESLFPPIVFFKFLIYIKRNGNICTHKDLHTDVHCNIISQ